MVALTLIVKAHDKGPAFFAQERIGQDGSRFKMLKFRSMRTDAEKDGQAVWAQKNDARVTRVGAFIRKCRIDELPQLINVLRGDMSLVGPRPEVPRYVALYPAALRAQLLALRPGLTDPASLANMDESERLAKAAVQASAPARVRDGSTANAARATTIEKKPAAPSQSATSRPCDAAARTAGIIGGGRSARGR